MKGRAEGKAARGGGKHTRAGIYAGSRSERIGGDKEKRSLGLNCALACANKSEMGVCKTKAVPSRSRNESNERSKSPRTSMTRQSRPRRARTPFIET